MTADAFTRALARTVVAQIFDGVGVHSAQVSVLDTLSDVMLRYVSTIGERAHAYAEHAGRTESNLNDVLFAFSDLGASVTDLMKYVEFSEEIPFAHPIPKFPVKKKARLTVPSFEQMGEEAPSNIPSWLPAFPDKHTYVSTPTWVARKNDARMDRVQQGTRKRLAEDALVSLHRRVNSLIAGNGKELWGGHSEEPIKTESKPELASGNGSTSLEIRSLRETGQGAGSAEATNPFFSPSLTPASAPAVARLNDLGLPPDFEPDALVMEMKNHEITQLLPPTTMIQSFSKIMEAKKAGKEDLDEIEQWEDEKGKNPEETSPSGWSGWRQPEKQASHFELSLLPLQRNKLQRKAMAARASLSTHEGMTEAAEGRKGNESDRDGGMEDRI